MLVMTLYFTSGGPVGATMFAAAKKHSEADARRVSHEPVAFMQYRTHDSYMAYFHYNHLKILQCRGWSGAA